MPFPGIQVSRFQSGLSNVSESNIFADMGQPDPTQVFTYFQDFVTYTAGDWVVTETDAAATEALTAGDQGLLLVTNTAADNDLVALQKTPAMLAFTAGKKFFFKTRFKVSDGLQSDVVFGVQIIDTTPLDVTDGMYFLKADDARTIDFICRKNATTGSISAAAIASLADDTYIELAFYYDGIASAYYAVNGNVLGHVDASSTYLPDATNLTVSFGLQNGEAVAKTMTVDYVYVAHER